MTSLRLLVYYGKGVMFYAQIIQLSHRLMLMHHGQTEEVHDLKALNKIYLPL